MRSTPCVSRACVLAAAFALSLSACPEPAPDEPPPPIVRVDLDRSTLLLVGQGGGAEIIATVWNAAGEAVDVAVTWESDRPDEIAVDAGRVTASVEVGSAHVTARAGDVTSRPALVWAARPAEGALLFLDDQVVQGPALLTDEPTAIVGSRITLVLSGVEPPEPGTVVLAREETRAAGTVVTATQETDGVRFELEARPLTELFEELSIRDSGPFGSAADMPDDALRTFSLGPLECETDTVEIEEPGYSWELETALEYTLDLDVSGFSLTAATVLIEGSITLAFEAGFELPDTLDGSVTCEVELLSPNIPIGGPIGMLVSPSVPMGLGFELKGALTGTELQIGVQGSAGVGAQLGFSWTEAGGFVDLSAVEDPTFEIEPVFVVPDLEEDVRLEASARVYAWADLHFGLTLADDVSWSLLESEAGPKQSANLGFPLGQVLDSAYASDYGLALDWAFVTGEDLATGLEYIGLDEVLSIDVTGSLPIASSPTGELAIEAGPEDLTFAVTLAPDSVDYSLFGYNVDSVIVYRLVDDALEVVAELEAVAGQTEFELTWTPPEALEGAQTFGAFVETSLLPFVPLEVGASVWPTLPVHVESVTATDDSPTDAIDAEEQILDYLNHIEAEVIYLGGQVTYWLDMADYYQATGQYVAAVNALDAAEAFSIQQVLMSDQAVYWAEFLVALRQVAQGTSLLNGGAAADDWSGPLEELVGALEPGCAADAGFEPSWGGMPAGSATHKLITAALFGDSPRALLSIDLRVAGVPGDDLLALAASDFLWIAPYHLDSDVTVLLDGLPWASSSGGGSFAGVEAVGWLEPGLPHEIAIEMSTPIMDEANFPAWALTATMVTRLWAFELVVDEAPSCGEGG